MQIAYIAPNLHTVLAGICYLYAHTHISHILQQQTRTPTNYKSTKPPTPVPVEPEEMPMLIITILIYDLPSAVKRRLQSSVSHRPDWA